MKKAVTLVFLFIINFEQITLLAQKSNLSFQHFGIKEGLSSEFIATIYQDHIGYMWFLTGKGLDRYDGYNFISYKYPANDKVVSGLFPASICEDKDGNLWIASMNGGIEKFDPKKETFKNYLPDPKQPATDWCNMVISICIDKDEVIWVGTGDGFYKFNKNNETFISFKHNENDPYSLGHKSVNCIYEDRSGILWLATGGGLDRFDKTTNKFYHYWHYPNNQWGDNKTSMHWALSIEEDVDGFLWIGTDGGLLKFDKKDEKFTLFRHSAGQINQAVLSLSIDDYDHIWFCPLDGLGVFNKKSQTFKYYRHDANHSESINSNNIYSIFIDKEGSIWIGTQDKGLNKLDFPNPTFQKYLNIPSKIADPSLETVFDLYEDKNGTIWVGTNRGLKIFDSVNQTVVNHLNFNNLGIEHDRSGNFYFVPQSGGMYKLSNTNQWTCYSDSNTFSYPDLIRSLYEGANGRFWFGNIRGDLYSFYPSANKIKWITNIKNIIWTIYEDTYGLVWFGGDFTGLFCYDPVKDSVSEYNPIPNDSSSLIDNTFCSYYEDKKGTLWLGCGTGIVKFNRKKNNFTRYYGNEGFLKNMVMQILDDNSGNLWMSTGYGITKFNPSNSQFNNYYSLSYFQEVKVAPQVGIRAKNGEMYFGGENGFIRFHPDSIKENTFIPPIAITAFKKFEKYYPFGKEIELKHNDNYLTFEFAALSYIHSEENQYAYMMEGIDKDWVYCGTRRDVAYPNLPPGEYIFRVKGSTVTEFGMKLEHQSK